MSYWVVGGEYIDTNFEAAAPGKELERHGPFENYKSAYEVWSSRAWATVDNALCRFRILKHDDDVNGEDHVRAPHELPHHN